MKFYFSKEFDQFMKTMCIEYCICEEVTSICIRRMTSNEVINSAMVLDVTFACFEQNPNIIQLRE